MEELANVSIPISSATWVAFLSYLIFVIGVGIYVSRKSSKGLSAYFLGERSLNRWVVALSAVVSGRSAWLLLGMTGLAYVRGVSAIWAALGYIVVEWFLFYYFAPKLRRNTEKMGAITVPDFFAMNFGDNRRIRILTSVIIFLFMMGYVAAQFVAGGKAFASGFGISQITGIWLTAGIVLLYTLTGGYLAVSITDFVQAFFMISGLVLVPIVAFFALPEGAFQQVSASLDTSTFFSVWDIGFGVALGFVGIGLGSPGNPHIMVRYMSIDDPEQLKVSAIVGTVWNVVMALGAVSIGVVGRFHFPESSLLPAGDSEQIFPFLAGQMLSPFFFGAIIASIFAAIMSTADSQLLVAASCLVNDIYVRLSIKSFSDTDPHLVWLSRMVVLILVLISVALAFFANELVFWLVLFAWAGLGASIGPAAISVLFWKRTSVKSVFWGMLSGTFTVIIWKMWLADWGYELIPGFLVATFVIWLFAEGKPKELG